MKKNIFAIGMISLFIGIAVLPICNASTTSTVLPTSKDDGQKPLGKDRTFFVKAQVEGTVTNFHEGFIGGKGIAPIRISGRSPHLTITPAYYGETQTFELEWPWTFTARFATECSIKQIGTDTYYIKGTFFCCRIALFPE